MLVEERSRSALNYGTPLRLQTSLRLVFRSARSNSPILPSPAFALHQPKTDELTP